MSRHKKRKTSHLSVREGISPNDIWLPGGDWPTMLEFLVFRFPEVGAQRWCERMRQNEVVDEHGTAINSNTVYRAEARLYYYRELDSEPKIPFEEAIVFQDDHIVVADKPHFLPVAPSGRYLKETLQSRLRCKLGIDHLVPMHRIDRETAGLVIFSKNVQTRHRYHALFREHKITKTYEAVAKFDAGMGLPLTYRSRIVEGPEFFRRQEAAGEANAITRVDVIERRGDLALYRLNPVTGKTHQLRVHMTALGIAILNDPLYPVLRDWKGDDFSQPLQLLAKSVEFVDPVSGEARRFESGQRL